MGIIVLVAAKAFLSMMSRAKLTDCKGIAVKICLAPEPGDCEKQSVMSTQQTKTARKRATAVLMLLRRIAMLLLVPHCLNVKVALVAHGYINNAVCFCMR